MFPGSGHYYAENQKKGNFFRYLTLASLVFTTKAYLDYSNALKAEDNAYLAYKTAWLKTNYPAEFMSANLTSEMSNINRIVILINECRKLKIKVNAPDINISDIQFHPVSDEIISYGLNAIKNVGTKALENIS